MPVERILILGGTGEARTLAGALLAKGFSVVSSLAGVTVSPLLPPGEIRSGGFGGEAGLVDYIRRGNIDAIVDATHPFAAQISRQACDAALATGIRHCRLERPAWTAEAGDIWMGAGSIAEAVSALPHRARPLVTIGRKEIASFFARADLAGVVRMIEPPGEAVPEHWRLILARPPFRVEDEGDLLDSERISHVVAKNAGGEETRAKLLAARAKRIPVVMISRPRKQGAATHSSIDAVIQSLCA